MFISNISFVNCRLFLQRVLIEVWSLYDKYVLGVRQLRKMFLKFPELARCVVLLPGILVRKLRFIILKSVIESDDRDSKVKTREKVKTLPVFISWMRSELLSSLKFN